MSQHIWGCKTYAIKIIKQPIRKLGSVKGISDLNYNIQLYY